MWSDTFLITKGQFAVIIQILLGISVLFLGRKLFWLFVGVVGFITGALLAGLLFQGSSGWLVFIVALACGVLGALLAVVLQRLSIAVSGFLAGGYVSVVLVRHWGWITHAHPWGPFVIGGIIGAILLSIIFDPALIVLSSLVGALLIVQPLGITPVNTALLFALLAAAGMITQAVVPGKHSHRPSK